MCYKSPWGRGREKRRPSTLAEGMATGCKYQAGPQLSSRAARVTERSTIRN
jgi:hypothetical protein